MTTKASLPGKAVLTVLQNAGCGHMHGSSFTWLGSVLNYFVLELEGRDRPGSLRCMLILDAYAGHLLELLKKKTGKENKQNQLSDSWEGRMASQSQVLTAQESGPLKAT